MLRIVDRQEDIATDRHLFEFRVYPDTADPDRVLGHAAAHWIIEGDQVRWLGTDFGAPVLAAFVRVLRMCERHDIEALWVNDPQGLFPLEKRPAWDPGTR